MLNEEFAYNQNNPHTQDPPAQTPLAAQGVRQRRRTITLTGPIVLLCIGCLIAIGVIAGIIGSWTTGAIEAAQFRADLMLISCTVGALLTFAGMGWWKDRRATARHEEARGWAEAHDRLIIEQYTALARRVVGLELLVEEYGAKAVADATRIAAAHVGKLTHRMEQSEAVAAGWDQKLAELRDDLTAQIGAALVDGLRGEGKVVALKPRAGH